MGKNNKVGEEKTRRENKMEGKSPDRGKGKVENDMVEEGRERQLAVGLSLSCQRDLSRVFRR